MRTFEHRLERLIAASRQSGRPAFTDFIFPTQLDQRHFPMPEPLLTLYHHPIYARLSREQRWRLSLLEAVNFFSVAIHGERAIMAGIAQRLYRSRFGWDGFLTSRYLQHYIQEDNRHTCLIAEYCQRYHGQVLPDLAMGMDRGNLSAIGEDLLFYGRMLVFEAFLSFLNNRVVDDDSVDPVSREMHKAHHGDEARHVAFGRIVLTTIARELASEGSVQELRYVGQQLLHYAQATVRRLYNASLYRHVGLDNGVQLIQEARALPARRALDLQWQQATTSLLYRLHLIRELPERAA